MSHLQGAEQQQGGKARYIVQCCRYSELTDQVPGSAAEKVQLSPSLSSGTCKLCSWVIQLQAVKDRPQPHAGLA